MKTQMKKIIIFKKINSIILLFTSIYLIGCQGQGATNQDKLIGVRFRKVDLGEEVYGKHSSLVLGPEGKLYASTLDGTIKRFFIQKDGTLKLEHTFTPFGEETKFLIGLAFDPSSNPDSLVCWITYCNHLKIMRAPHWDGRLARLQLSSKSNKVLENTLVLTNLPRSSRDHLTNSISIKDSFLYFPQGSTSSMGRADGYWGNRTETLLSGTLLRLDLSKIPSRLPLDVKTTNGNDSYDPFAKEAPLTIYATGIRNAYDLVWHSNGNLYIPVNGAKEGGNTPSSNPHNPYYVPPHPSIHYNGPNNIPSVTDVRPAQKDWLLRIEKGGYYGHPNPIRAEYVFGRGEKDISNYMYKGVKPAPNFRGYSFDFGRHQSPNGIIEYQSDSFGGRLKGLLMVVRFSKNDDILLLEPGGEKQDIEQSYPGYIVGLTGFNDPLDLIEDTRNGNIYISEYGGKGKITLLKPGVPPKSEKERKAL